MTAVIVLHFNRIDLTKACVKSILGQTVAPGAIYVVDNGSTEHDAAALATALPAHESLHILRAAIAGGFAYGNNLGIRAALMETDADTILLLNNDTTCPPDLLEKANAFLRANPRIGLLGCEMEGRDGGDPQAAGKSLSKPFWLPVPVPSGTRPDYLQGSCLFIPRTTLESIGLLDESFHFFCEDTDYSLRVRDAGLELGVLPGVRIFHHGSATISGTSAKQAAWYRAGHRMLLTKRTAHPTALELPLLAFRVFADAIHGRFAAARGNLHGFRSLRLGTDERLRAIPEGTPIVAVDLLFLVPGQVGGSETYVRETLDAMARQALGTVFILYTNRENHNSLLARFSRFPNIVFAPVGVRAASKAARFVAEFITLPRLVRRHGADVLWCPGNLCPIQAPCPVVTTLHDMQYRRFPEDYSRAMLPVMKALTALTLRHSNRILAISEFTKSEIRRFSEVPAERIFVVPHGVSPRFDGALSHSNADSPVLLCVANSYPHKRLEDSVRIFAALADRFPTLRLRIVGRPRLGEPAIRTAIQALSSETSARIERIPYLEGDALVDAIRSSSVFLFPSHYEGFGLPVLEALMAGAPVVACRAASVPEVGGSFVRYYEPGDLAEAVRLVEGLLRTPPSEAERLAAREHARSFTWERTARETLRILLPRPRVTVVTPCFNSAATLPALLDSIDAQAADNSVFELEHIVMDGGSTDGTLDLLAGQAKPWRTVVSQRDKGPADAINHGFARATGTYIAWLNADDAYASGALRRALRVLERNPRASFAFGRCPIIDAAGTEIRKPITRFKEFFFPFHSRFVLQILNYVSQPASLFRRQAFLGAGPLRLDFKAAWDYDLLLRLLHHGPSVRISGREPTAFFRWTPGSISGSNFARQFDEELAIATADTGRFSIQTLLHRCVRWGIVTIYSAMARR